MAHLQIASSLLSQFFDYFVFELNVCIFLLELLFHVVNFIFQFHNRIVSFGHLKNENTCFDCSLTTTPKIKTYRYFKNTILILICNICLPLRVLLFVVPNFWFSASNRHSLRSVFAVKTKQDEIAKNYIHWYCPCAQSFLRHTCCFEISSLSTMGEENGSATVCWVGSHLFAWKSINFIELWLSCVAFVSKFEWILSITPMSSSL